jgi:hypothetical protein
MRAMLRNEAGSGAVQAGHPPQYQSRRQLAGGLLTHIDGAVHIRSVLQAAGRATSVTLQNTIERAAVLASAIIHSDPRSVDQYAGIRLVADTPL